MLYVSTRGKTDMVSSAHAISSGLAKDGGLLCSGIFLLWPLLRSMP